MSDQTGNNPFLDGLNPSQRDAVVHSGSPLLIVAGAGSGKTRVLTNRIAYLLAECGVAPYEVMAITFTNKAAGEMRERVAALVGPRAKSMWVTTFHSEGEKSHSSHTLLHHVHLQQHIKLLKPRHQNLTKDFLLCDSHYL